MFSRPLPRFLAAILAGALPAAGACALGACSGGPRSSLTIEVAPGAACSMPSDAFEGTWDCLRIQICPSAPLGGEPLDAGAPRDAGARDAGTGGGGCVEITTTDGDHENADDELIIGRASRVTFDARVEQGRRYDVSVIVYDDSGAPVATGTTRYATVSSGGVHVRLHRYGQSSCAGVGPGDALPAHRAFGAAVPMPNGDVLFLGGVTGDRLGAAQLSALSRFQRAVQIYDVSEGRFFDVSIQDLTRSESDTGGFARVLFEARRIGTESDGRERIRVFGGFGSTSPDAIAARLDQSLVYTMYGTPIAPSAESDIRRVVDILYDPIQRSATIDFASAMVEPLATGGAAVSEVVGGTVVTVGGLTGNGGPTMLADLLEPTVADVFQVWDSAMLVGSFDIGDDTAMPMNARRFGATVTHLSDSSYLVWGGGVAVADAASIRAHAGARIDTDMPNGSTLIAAPEGGSLPAPVAYHTATGLAPNHVLIVGGVTIGGDLSMPPTARLDPAAAAFSILVDEAGVLRGVGVSGDPRPPTMLHQATVIAESGGVPSAVLLTGGAITRLEPMISATVTTLWSTAEVGVLTGSADSWSYRVLDLQLRTARFGHTTTLIPGVGVLVSGGYRAQFVTMPSAATELLPVLESEVFLIEDLLDLPRPASVNCDAGTGGDAGRRDAAGGGDAGVPDDAPMLEDAPIEMMDAPI